MQAHMQNCWLLLNSFKGLILFNSRVEKSGTTIEMLKRLSLFTVPMTKVSGSAVKAPVSL